MTPESRLAELHLTLPPAPEPVAVYKPLVIVDRLAYVSGHGPWRADKSLITGVVGRDLSLEEGQAAARQVGLAILATLRKHLGDLNRVKRLVKVLGMVNTRAPIFTTTRKSSMAAANSSPRSGERTSASARAAPWAWDRSRPISPWRSKRFLNSTINLHGLVPTHE
ncbi:MAG: RidA family protein [Chthoniobacter sp.]